MTDRMPVNLILEEDLGLFYDPNVAGRLLHGTFQGGNDTELEHAGAVSCTTNCSYGTGGGGRVARVMPAISRTAYGNGTQFLSGNQIVWEALGRVDSYPVAIGAFFHKGLNIASADASFIFLTINDGSVVLQVRLSDATVLPTLTSAAGVNAIGVDHEYQFIYNGQAGVGNDTLAMFIDGVKVANDTTHAAGLADINNTASAEMALSANTIAPVAITVTECRIRTGTV